MTLWLPLIILAASPDAPMEHPGAEVVYRTRFEQDDDINFDAWPDEWTRRRGEGFPLFVNIAIAAEADAPESHGLRITLDGGAATVYSPPITIDPHYSYVLQGRLRTSQLQRDTVFLSLTFSSEPREDAPNAAGEIKETHVSSKFTDVPAWRHVELGPITPASLSACNATIGLHVLPAGRPDLRGVIWFDDLRLLRLPQLAVTSGNKQNIFFDPQDVAFTCVAGLGHDRPEVQWELFDAAGRSLATETMTVAELPTDAAATVTVPPPAPARNRHPVRREPQTSQPASPGDLATARTWPGLFHGAGHVATRGRTSVAADRFVRRNARLYESDPRRVWLEYPAE